MLRVVVPSVKPFLDIIVIAVVVLDVVAVIVVVVVVVAAVVVVIIRHDCYRCCSCCCCCCCCCCHCCWCCCCCWCHPPLDNVQPNFWSDWLISRDWEIASFQNHFESVLGKKKKKWPIKALFGRVRVLVPASSLFFISAQHSCGNSDASKLDRCVHSSIWLIARMY